MSVQQARIVNGIDAAAIEDMINTVAKDPSQGQSKWSATTNWRHGVVSDTHVSGYQLAGKTIPRKFTLTVDEPVELGGTDTMANPAEYLLAGLNSCMTVGYVMCAALMGIRLTSLEIHTSGNIDLRGVLGIDTSRPAGFESLHYTVKIKGDGTPQQFAQLHAMVTAQSPNRWNIANPVKLTSELIVQ